MVSQKEIHVLRLRKEEYDRNPTIPEFICSIHSGISAVLGAWCCTDMESFGEELAHTVMLIMDMSECLQIDLEQAIEKRHLINQGRPYRDEDNGGM